MLYSVRDTDPASLQNLQFFASFGVREEDNTAYFVFLHDGSGREVRQGRGKPWGLCDAAEFQVRPVGVPRAGRSERGAALQKREPSALAGLLL